MYVVSLHTESTDSVIILTLTALLAKRQHFSTIPQNDLLFNIRQICDSKQLYKLKVFDSGDAIAVPYSYCK